MTDLPDNCLCAKPKYPELNETEPRHIFFFEEGTVVFWNVSQVEQNNMLDMILKHSELYYTQEARPSNNKIFVLKMKNL